MSSETSNTQGEEPADLPIPLNQRLATFLIPVAAVLTLLLNLAVLRSSKESVLEPTAYDRMYERTELILETLAGAESIRDDLSGADLHEVYVAMSDPGLFEDIEEVALNHPDNFVLSNLWATHERVGRIFCLTFDDYNDREEGAIGWPEPELGAHEVHSILRVVDLSRRTQRCLDYLAIKPTP